MKLIQSRDNSFFKGLKRLAESGRDRRKSRRTLLDGVHLVEAYEKACGPVERLVVAASALTGGEIADFVAGRDVIVIADALMRDLGLVETPSGLVAVAPIPAAPAVDPEKDAILLDGIQDPGNVGTLLRTAAAAGIRQALLGPGCAAAWSPKVLRAGQGAHFVLNIVEDADLGGFMAAYRGTTVATSLGAGARSLYEVCWDGPLAWVFGAEGQGMRPELLATAKLRVHIPMPGAVESLNVGAASAVCLFEMVRRRSG